VGWRYLELKQWKRAIKYLQQALEMFNKLAAPEMTRADCLSSLSQCYHEQGKLDRAIEFGKQCLAMERQLYEQTLARWQEMYVTVHLDPSRLCDILNRLGGCYYESKNWSVAADHFTEAVNLIKKYPGNNPDNVKTFENNLSAATEKWEAEKEALCVIDLVPSKKISNEELVALIRENPGVTSLDLSHCERISDRGLIEAFSNMRCYKLTKIDLSSCTIRDPGLKAVVKACPNLVEVKLRFCVLITKSGLDKLVTECHNLKHIDVQFCEFQISQIKAYRLFWRKITFSFDDVLCVDLFSS
jgi:tetratricopeptide (TPR) repeat protein